MKTLATALLLTSATTYAQTAWQPVATQNTAEKHHENAVALVGDSLYVIGGRGPKPLEALNLKTTVWQRLPTPPVEMHHFQAVTYNNEVYVIGAFTGNYPHETPLPVVHIYSPQQHAWRTGAEIPAERRRGSAGVAVYNDKIYVVCGITDGHYDGHVAWLDEFDPKTGQWRRLTDAPRPRDHVQAAVVGDKLYVAGGRLSSAKIGKVLELTVPETDVYDFKTGQWTTLPPSGNIPTQRAGCTAVALNGKVYVMGGETTQLLAHNQTEILDPKTGRWTSGPAMQQGRHGTQAVVYRNHIYIADGSANHGGGPELNTVEVLK